MVNYILRPNDRRWRWRREGALTDTLEHGQRQECSGIPWVTCTCIPVAAAEWNNHERGGGGEEEERSSWREDTGRKSSPESIIDVEGGSISLVMESRAA